MTQYLTRRLVAWAVVVAILLTVPVIGMQVSDEWKWGPLDFILAGTVLFGSALAYELIARKGGSTAYRAAVGVGVATALFLMWVNAAAGIIGDGPVNLLYFGVIAIGMLGACIARLEPRGMARTLFAMAVAQMLVPAIALVIWKAGWQDLLMDRHSPHPPFAPGILPVFGLNAFFAMLFVTSALLFRRSGGSWSKTRGEERSREAIAD